MDPRNGLLDAMFSAGCLNRRDKHSIEVRGDATDEDQNERLYQIVLWGSEATYKGFINCLLQTRQYQVVSLLEPSLVGGIRPINDEQQSRLQKNYVTLVRLIKSKDGLTAEMFSADCITWQQKEYIESTSRESESNKRLLDIVRRGSETDFAKVIECLNATGQHHVSRILTEDGAVAHIVATISPISNRKQREGQIVDQLTALLLETPVERIDELYREARQRINQLLGNDVAILTAETGHSIGLFYFTTSIRGMQYLHEIYSSEQLKSMMQELFTLLLKNYETDDASRDLRVVTLRWNPSNYIDCLQQLFTFTNLPILSHVYKIAKRNQQLAPKCDDVRSLPIDQLPFELFEMILVKAIGHLFVIINRTTPARAGVYTRATMMAVSHLWWAALSHRKYIKRLLKRYFKRVCHPYKCSPLQVTSLHIEGGMELGAMGVAVLNNELYVACWGSKVIQVFDNRPPFSRRENIKVQGLEHANDITVCSKSSQLYIADATQCAIFRVNLLYNELTDKFITEKWVPWSLSVNSSRLLITPHEGKSLYLYGDDGNELHHIELPHYMDALHAVEKTHNAYIVSYRNRFIADVSHRDSVTEVDVNGRVHSTMTLMLYTSTILATWC